MNGRRTQLLAIAGPPTAWAIHFVLIYSVISAQCAPRALLDPASSWIIAGVGTAILVLAAILPAFFLRRIPERPLVPATIWLAVISVVAILFDTAFLFTFPTCGG
ncbi:hypothetical protein [Histidinibacterium aquaticum]|uniref:Uncharacterized protein n=1 Tax=Histidinibacterium aquaticum TaxID=2613962 RepID=A0A5J5GG15_9RHOB|nr:hypothetical protein [Histidinibacterium aquaticum]KAA9006950.1 hypothetical protein F3S47_14375 [Histidinibacterium aquaticum]